MNYSQMGSLWHGVTHIITMNMGIWLTTWWKFHERNSDLMSNNANNHSSIAYICWLYCSQSRIYLDVPSCKHAKYVDNPAFVDIFFVSPRETNRMLVNWSIYLQSGDERTKSVIQVTGNKQVVVTERNWSVNINNIATWNRTMFGFGLKNIHPLAPRVREPHPHAE